MSEGTLLLLAAVLVLVSLSAAVLAWVSSVRSVAEYRDAMDRTVLAKEQELRARSEQLTGRDEALDALKEEVGFLKELESVRLADRYMETKNGLEERLHRLETKRQRWRTRVTEHERSLEELLQSREQKAAELERLRSELARTQLDSRTLEQALQAVSTLGGIPVSDLQEALSRRRRRQAQVTSRLDQLSLDGEAKAAEVERLKGEIERATREVEQVEREIEITRAAGPILDSLLGITADMREKLARIDDQLDRSLRSLGSGSGRDPIADFLVAAAGETRERSLLLAAGAAGAFAGAGSAEAPANDGRPEDGPPSAEEIRDPVPAEAPVTERLERNFEAAFEDGIEEAAPSARLDASGKASQPARPDASGKASHPARPDAPEKASHPARPDAPGKASQPARPDASEKASQPARPDASSEAEARVIREAVGASSQRAKGPRVDGDSDPAR